MKNLPGSEVGADRCIRITKSGARCSLKCTPWGDGTTCGAHFHRAPAAPTNHELAEWVRSAVENDPQRLKRVASLLLASPSPPRSQPSATLQERLDAAAARGWARFRQKLEHVTSYAAAQTLSDAVPRDAQERERSFYLHLGRFLQTREVPETATAEERTELERLLLRLASSATVIPRGGGRDLRSMDGAPPSTRAV